MPLPRLFFPSLIFVAIAFAVVPIRAADQPSKPDTPRAAAQGATPLETIIPSVEFQDLNLEDAVAFLQDKVPGFKAVVVRDPGAPAAYPTIRLKLKGVALGQILELLQSAYPGIEAGTIEGGGGTLYCFKVHGPTAGGPTPPLAVKVYPLTDLVATVIKSRPEEPKDKTAATKESLDQILSVIKATLEQASDSGAAPVLQVHEETRTLIFKGSAEQREALESVLAALQQRHPLEEKQISDLKERAEGLQRNLEMVQVERDQKIEELKHQLDSLRKSLEQREEIYLRQAADVERLKARLEFGEEAVARERALRQAQKPDGKP